MTMIHAPEILQVEDGIYESVPDSVYRSWRRMSASCLGPCVKKDGSMKTLKASWDGLLSCESDDLDFGIAFHCRMLEPDRYAKEFVVSLPCQAIIKSTGEPCGCCARYTKNGQWLCGKHAPEDAEEPERFLSPDDAAILKGMAKSVFEHPAVALLRQHGGCEVSIAWTDPSGVKCKGRLDKWIPDFKWPGGDEAPVILDLKTVKSAVLSDAEWAIERYGWHWRAAMYIDGVERITGIRPGYCFVMIEKTFPYEIGVYWLRERSIKRGQNIYTSLLQRWAFAQKHNKYPGINGDDVIDIDIPARSLREDDEV